MTIRTMPTLLVAMLVAIGAAAQAPSAPAPATQPPATSTTGTASDPRDPSVQAVSPLYQPPDAPDDSDAQTTVNTPLTGMQSGSLDLLSGKKQLIPSFRVVQTLSAQQDKGAPDTYLWTGHPMVAGNLQFVYNWRKSGVVAYTGTSSWTSRGNSDVIHLHQLSLQQGFRVGRFRFMVSDYASYSTNSTFGFAGLQGLGGNSGMSDANSFASGVGGFGAAQPGIAAKLLPEQSVGGNGARVSNTAAGQVEYAFSALDSVTTSFSASTLRGVDSDLLDTMQYSVTAGYNKRLTARSSTGVSYTYSDFTYDQVARDMQNHQIGFMYGRKVGRRFNFKGEIGVQVAQGNEAGTEFRRVLWGSSAEMQYSRTKTSARLQFIHSVTGGSGVLPGAQTSRIQGAVTRQLGRKWQASVQGGYAQNTAMTGPAAFYSEFGGAALHRYLTRQTTIYLDYSVQNQTTSGPCLAAVACDGKVQHVFGLGFNFNGSPIRIGE